MHRSIPTLVVVLAVCISSFGCTPKPDFTGRVRVISYNADDADTLAPEIERAIRETNPDVVCVQEARVGWCHYFKNRLGDRYRTAMFADAGFGEAVSSALMFSGERPAFFSKYAIQQIRYLPYANTGCTNALWSDVWLVEAQTPAGPIKLVSASLNNNLSSLEDIVAAVGTESPALIMGEFSRHRTDPAIAKVEQKGYIDVLPKFDSQTPTWRGFRHLLPSHAQRDHVMCSQHLHPDSARVLTTRASKHCPVYAELSLMDNLTTLAAEHP